MPDRDAVLATAPGQLRAGVLTSVFLAAVLATPWAAGTLGIPRWLGASITLPYAGWTVFVRRVLAPRCDARPWLFQLAAVGNLVLALVATVALAASTFDPRPPV